MRWSIIRLIWLRELRDQMRDRRTLFMVVVLPVLLYPVLGFVVVQFALGFMDKPSLLGVVCGKGEEFPARGDPGEGRSIAPYWSWFTLGSPALPGSGSGLEQWVGATALVQAGQISLDYPPLIRAGRFPLLEDGSPNLPPLLLLSQARLKIIYLASPDRAPLMEKKVDLILSASPAYYRRLEKGDRLEPGPRPALTLQVRPDDERSRQAASRLAPLLDQWERELKRVRLLRNGFPPGFDHIFDINDPETSNISGRRNLFDLMVRVFPFMLVMWSLAGALYPAVDLCAGEKERGTMETLLISPAGREEIVYGKFLTIWVFSAATAVLNLASMGLTTWQFGNRFPAGALPLGALAWCLVLVLPLSAFFSAICLAVGAYARSSKEGQYYLMPLFIVTMPLIFLTLAPGVELSPFYSLVPVTGVALLMQRLMTTADLMQIPWLYFLPVLAPTALYSWLALRWAIEQFHREEVLFREAERLDLRLWFKHLLRDKEPLATTGQALFCFGLLIALRWLGQGLGRDLSTLVHSGVSLVAFVAAPPLLITVMLNTQVRQTLQLRWPRWREIGVAAVLALLLLPPLAALTQWLYVQFPNLSRLLEDRQPLVQEFRQLSLDPAQVLPALPAYLLVFALLSALCEEVAFRGFILTGLLGRFRPRTAIILCSLLFALYHLNVFQFLPSFFLGVVLGLVTVRSRSLVPGVIFHLLHNSLLLLGLYLAVLTQRSEPTLAELINSLWPWLIAICVVLGCSLLWWLYRRPYVALARQLAAQQQAQGK